MRQFTPGEFQRSILSMCRRYADISVAQWLPRRALAALQLRRLQRLVAHAYAHVPFYHDHYRAAGVHPADLQRLEDLQHFPLVTKEALLAAGPEATLARGVSRADCILSASSGTSGKMLWVAHTPEAMGVYAVATYRLFSMIMSYQPWHRQAYIYTSELPARSLLGTYPHWFIPTLTDAAQIWARLEQIQPHLLVCYPSHLRELTELRARRESSTLRPRAISVNSEASTAAERAALSKTWGCGVYEEYSTEELVRVAGECRHRRLHLFEDLVVLEAVDARGQPVPAGQVGDVVGTNLDNWAMPFIRYVQGDQVRLGDSDCPCGRGFRQILSLEGRSGTAFVLPDGRTLTSGYVLDLCYAVVLELACDVRAYRLTQDRLDAVTFTFVPGPGWSEADRPRVQAHFARHFGPLVTVTLREVQQIEKTATGKHVAIASHIDPRAQVPEERPH